MTTRPPRRSSKDVRGTFILVIGPSGAGKDTLITGARAHLADEERFVFPIRIITRPAGSRGEDHVAVDEAEFEKLRRGGGLALDWQAHGLRYGLPSSIAADLASGRHVVANVSRGIVSTARRLYAPVGCILVDARHELRRSRLGERGRETTEQVAERLAPSDGEDFGVARYVVRNEGSIEAGVASLLSAIRSLAGGI